jgi:hypothetical protein
MLATKSPDNLRQPEVGLPPGEEFERAPAEQGPRLRWGRQGG